MFDLFNLKQQAFGLDVSDLSLKIINLKKKDNDFHLIAFGEKSIPVGIIEGGEVKNEDSLAKIIRTAVSEVKGNKINTKYAVCSLPEEKAFLKVITMPKAIKKEEIIGAIQFEAENYIPFPVQDVYLDYQIVGYPDSGSDHWDILIAAIPKKIVDNYNSALKKAGLIPRVFEVESLAIARALIKDEISPSPLLLIDLGDTRTSFIIFSGNSVVFTASIPISSQTFSRAISKSLKISLSEAEKLKIKCGLENNDAKSKEIFEALIPCLTDLTEQIKKYLNYYQSHSDYQNFFGSKKGVEKILLSGGGSNLKKLSEFLLNELKIPVVFGNPWINISKEPFKEISRLSYEKSIGYTTALGLALRGIKENF